MAVALYAARNKDDEDDRFVEVPHDPALAKGYIEKAELIVDRVVRNLLLLDPAVYRLGRDAQEESGIFN